jgi:hypothetical protein
VRWRVDEGGTAQGGNIAPNVNEGFEIAAESPPFSRLFLPGKISLIFNCNFGIISSLKYISVNFLGFDEKIF